jgi:hypothetical protein
MSKVSQGEIVWEAPDDSGWTVHKLTTAKQLKEEGAALNHCVGAGGYEDVSIYSLRNQSGHPVITFEVDRSRVPRKFKGNFPGVIVQAKGHRNRGIGSKKTQRLQECLYTRAWLEDWLARSTRSKSRLRWVPSMLGNWDDFELCEDVILRRTGWDVLDETSYADVPRPIPTRRQEQAALKRL